MVSIVDLRYALQDVTELSRKPMAFVGCQRQPRQCCDPVHIIRLQG